MNVYYAFRNYDSYLQSPDEIYILEAGILDSFMVFQSGEDHLFQYDFEDAQYSLLKEKYHVEEIAGDGAEWERAAKLMNNYAERLQHRSYYDNHVPMNAIELLEYSLDRKENGINCRAKAQILNEMCLSLCMYARKVWIMPLPPYDNNYHVVNEVWDNSLQKWVMLDITNNQYWVNEEGVPLSALEIRENGANNAFCTPVCPEDDLVNLPSLKEKYIGSFLYIMKNMVYMEYCAEYGVSEIQPVYLLFSEGLNTEYAYILNEESVKCAPMQTKMPVH